MWPVSSILPLIQNTYCLAWYNTHPTYKVVTQQYHIDDSLSICVTTFLLSGVGRWWMLGAKVACFSEKDCDFACPPPRNDGATRTGRNSRRVWSIFYANGQMGRIDVYIRLKAYSNNIDWAKPQSSVSCIFRK